MKTPCGLGSLAAIDFVVLRARPDQGRKPARLTRFAALALLTALGLATELPPVFGYATGDAAGGKLSHQWITAQGWQLYRSQFGPSEIDGFLGLSTIYPTAAMSTVMEGIFAEDEQERNPYGQGATPVLGAVNHPSLRHFWTPNADFSRNFDRGLELFIPPIIVPPVIFPPRTVTYDSAANRGIKYFTGGRDAVGVADPEWGGGQGAMANIGIEQYYNLPTRRDDAYYYLGHAAHLLQDLTLPAHSQGDQHLEVSGVGVNPDPVHDWVDGIDFSSSIFTNPARRASFDDVNGVRYGRWRFIASSGGVGRPENAASILTGDLRSPSQMLDLAFNSTLDDPEIIASIPGALLNSIRPLYYQMLESASISDDFDARNAKGQVDLGNRGDLNGIIPDLNNYDNWTPAELDGVADVVVPRAMRATAELFRFFYSRVDPTPPELEVLGFSPSADHPTAVIIQPGESVVVKFLGTDLVSGIDLDGFDVSVAMFNPATMTWGAAIERNNRTLPGGGPIGMESFQNLAHGLYRARVANENGGGFRGQSAFAYFQVVPEPATLALAALAAAWPATRRLRGRRGGNLDQPYGSA